MSGVDYAACRAWGLVLEAIEEAIDTEDLRAHDRAALAWMHGYAESFIGQPPVKVPGVLELAVMWEDELLPERELVRFCGEHVTDVSTPYRLARAGIRSVSDLERATDEQLLAVPSIGPVKLRRIRAALRGDASSSGPNHA